MNTFVAAWFAVICVPLALLGLAFVFNVRDVGVRYWHYYRENWSWTRGIAAFHTPRATRVIAAATGLVWFLVAVFTLIVVVRALLR